MVYMAKVSFEPKIGHSYFLYERANEDWQISMVSPEQWGRKGMPFEAFIAKITLLSDHTWDISDGEIIKNWFDLRL